MNQIFIKVKKKKLLLNLSLKGALILGVNLGTNVK